MRVVENTIEQLKQLVAGKLDVNLKYEEIDLDAPLLDEGLGLDSLAIVELITLIEDEFGFQFGEGDLNMEAFASLRSLAKVIDAQRAVVPA
jgi:acyl carrier protein